MWLLAAIAVCLVRLRACGGGLILVQRQYGMKSVTWRFSRTKYQEYRSTAAVVGRVIAFLVNSVWNLNGRKE